MRGRDLGIALSFAAVAVFAASRAAPETDAPGSATPPSNWAIPADRAEEVLRDRSLQVLGATYAGAGVTGARKVEVVFEQAEIDEAQLGEGDVYLGDMSGEIALKVKPFPRRTLDDWNNNPRKEIAAYEVQKLFLEPADYVVPTTLGRCVPLESARRTQPEWESTLDGTSCVLVAISLWLQNVTVPKQFYDEARFRSDPAYARAYGLFNILTYLSDHRDNRTGNFLVSTDDAHPRAYAIDNGIAFGSRIYNWFVPRSYAWRRIVVPAVPESAVDRLRNVRREELDRFSVLAEFRKDEAGHLLGVEPSASLDPDRKVNIRGDVVQLGLTKRELDALWRRIERLLERVDEGRLDVF